MRRAKLRRWTEGQQEFMRFLCLPDVGRNKDIKSYDAFARSIHVSRNTLQNWERQPGFYEALQAMSRRVILEQEPEFLKGMAEEMRSKKPNDRIVMTYWRYVRPALLAELELTDSYLELKSDGPNLLEARNQRIWERIMELPADTRDVVFDILREATTEPEEGTVEVLDPEVTYITRALAAPLSDNPEETAIPAAPPPHPGGRPRLSPSDKHRLNPIRKNK